MTNYTNATRKEKEEILRNDSYFRRAQADFDLENRGRFAKPEPPQIAEYPPAAEWTRDRVPDEPPLNFDVNALDPVGEHHEVERSIALAEDAAPADISPAVGEPGSEMIPADPVLSPPRPSNQEDQ